MLDLFNDVPAFVAAAEMGNFSAAGRRLGLSRSAVGKAVARIESRVNARLFNRTTRAQTLTDEGRAFLERCSRAVAELRSGASLLEAGHRTVAGRLRVTMPVLFGRLRIAPVLMRLTDQYPDLALELDFRDRYVSLVEEGFDLAVRSGTSGDTAGLSTRTIGRHSMVLCAAPSLIEKLGAPGSPSDLQRYPAIVYHRDGWTEGWSFPDENGRIEVLEPTSRIRLADLGAMLDAALAGQGLAWLPDWLIGEQLANGELRGLLPDRPARSHQIRLCWPASPLLAARVQVAIEALSASYRDAAR